ncbi:MAG: hypothetical protein NW241_08140 [Bacteroidia bacterium]|nr:hypothetical protein [Bacteroidia bacterium]
MSGEEERRRMKEQMKAIYKDDLQKRKEFLEQVKQMRQTQKLNQALTEMTSGLQDDSEEWIVKLNEASSIQEAKIDMALDQALDSYNKLEHLAKQAELEKLSAQQLVLQMKREMGLLPPEEPPAEAPAAEAPPPADPEPPQKRLGDF